MARDIDLSGGHEALSHEDKLYLAQRGRLPEEHYDAQLRQELNLSKGVTLDTIGHTGTVEQLSTEELEKELAKRRARSAASVPKMTINNSDGTQEVIEARAEVAEDEEVVEVVEDYSSWTNAELRAELKNRGLSVDGAKSDLVARLEADDASEEE